MKTIASRPFPSSSVSTQTPVGSTQQPTLATLSTTPTPTKAVLQQPESALGADDLKGLAQKTTHPTQNAQAALQNFAPGAPHVKARTERPDIYPERVVVKDNEVGWNVKVAGYAPADFTAPGVIAAIGKWAEPVDVKLHKGAFQSTTGPVSVDERGRPLNPMGRTGVEGRGLLGKWGANPAGDPILTKINPKSGQLEMLVILRKDSQQWALPGGMVDHGENIFKTVARELKEETGVDLDFKDAKHVYSGYVDDRRNTDNAWMETTVKHKHISAKVAAALTPKGADDADEAKWLPLDKASVDALYASHGSFVKAALTNMLKDKSLPPSTRAQLRSILAE